MCVAAIAWAAHPRWRMVAIGNRDEFHGRPTAPLAVWDNGILAGRDLEAGGTWLGVHPAGRFALVTNLRTPGYSRPELASRGALVTDALLDQPPEPVPARNPFNLWLADGHSLHFASNHPEWAEHDLQPGTHGLSNGARGDRWFKTARLEDALATWLEQDLPAERLFDALRDETPQSLDPEDAFSPVFIANPAYGTRCSTVVLVDHTGQGRIIERSFGAGGALTGEVELEFTWPV